MELLWDGRFICSIQAYCLLAQRESVELLMLDTWRGGF